MFRRITISITNFGKSMRKLILLAILFMNTVMCSTKASEGEYVDYYLPNAFDIARIFGKVNVVANDLELNGRKVYISKESKLSFSRSFTARGNWLIEITNSDNSKTKYDYKEYGDVSIILPPGEEKSASELFALIRQNTNAQQVPQMYDA